VLVFEATKNVIGGESGDFGNYTIISDRQKVCVKIT
jgi:hypothetical protein